VIVKLTKLTVNKFNVKYTRNAETEFGILLSDILTE